MKNRTKIENELNTLAFTLDASISFGREDGYTWISLEGGSINPHVFDVVSQQIADASGRSFFFSSCGINSIEGALDADMPHHMPGNKIPNSYLEEGKPIADYGHEFKPVKL